MAHTEDIEAHLQSIEEDMEYWRTKRAEPQIFRLIRKGRISFYDIIEASKGFAQVALEQFEGHRDSEEWVGSLELALGDYIKTIGIAASIVQGQGQVLVEEGREESGTYDKGFKFEHRKVSGNQEERLSQLERLLSENRSLLRVYLAVLVKKGMISQERLDEMLAAPVAPRYENGAQIVARSWLDPDFKTRLFNDAKRTLRELGFALNRTPKLVVVENTDSVHNVIVCTLCSCYPYELLGNPPWWYKHDSYKEAIIKNPRKTLAEMFKFEVPERTEIRVYDSTSDIRYMVLPTRPPNTEGLSEDELAKTVTEESMIGVAEARRPVLSRVD